MTNDPLESELETMGPRPLSEGFMVRFDARLSAGRPARRLAGIMAALVAAAACVAVAVVAKRLAWVPHASQPRPVVSRQIERPEPKPIATLAQYQRAYQKSPETLEAMLQQRPAGATKQPVDHSYDVVRYDVN
jgi:hypothetical protein